MYNITYYGVSDKVNPISFISALLNSLDLTKYLNIQLQPYLHTHSNSYIILKL